jgi:hypothetical protein
LQPPIEGPHCLLCKHREACVLPQRETGLVCGWYNARVAKLVTKAQPKHRLLPQRERGPGPAQSSAG